MLKFTSLVVVDCNLTILPCVKYAPVRIDLRNNSVIWYIFKRLSRDYYLWKFQKIKQKN